MRAVWNGQIIAEPDDTVVVEGNPYFPPGSVRRQLLQPSSRHTRCPWKGPASYYDVVVDGQVNAGAAWYYPASSPAADHIKDHVAFWQRVRVERGENEVATGVWQRLRSSLSR